MGQQQLLLLVLGIVIVGIAVVAGITAFSEGKDKADRDAASSDAMRLISDLQAWKLKPAAFGGGASASGFTGVSFTSIGIPSGSLTGGNYTTTNGCYTLDCGHERGCGRLQGGLGLHGHGQQDRRRDGVGLDGGRPCVGLRLLSLIGA